MSELRVRPITSRGRAKKSLAGKARPYNSTTWRCRIRVYHFNPRLEKELCASTQPGGCAVRDLTQMVKGSTVPTRSGGSCATPERGGLAGTEVAPPNPHPSNRGVTDRNGLAGLGAAEPSDRVAVAWMGVHWFAGTTTAAPSLVLEAVSALRDGAPIVEHSRGARGGYSNSATCAGVFVAWGANRCDVFVSISGDTCEELGIPGLAALSASLQLEPSSRLDVAWDTDLFTPETAGQAFEAGEVVARIQRSRNPETGRMKGIERRSNHEGDTVYLGSRTSERFVRFYDRRGPTRVEMELKERRAVELWRRMMALNDEAAWGMEALAELRHFLDFREIVLGTRSGKLVTPADRPLLPWWAEFVQGAARRSTVLPRKAPKLESMDKWLRRQVAPVLALVVDAYGPAVVRDLMTLGRSRYAQRPDRVALLHAAQQESVTDNAAD